MAVDWPGQHELRWTLYSKTARRAAYGTIVLAAAEPESRPPFGRLGGITSYLSARSINMHIDLLAQILAVAVDHGHLQSNPAVGKRDA